MSIQPFDDLWQKVTIQQHSTNLVDRSALEEFLRHAEHCELIRSHAYTAVTSSSPICIVLNPEERAKKHLDCGYRDNNSGDGKCSEIVCLLQTWLTQEAPNEALVLLLLGREDEVTQEEFLNAVVDNWISSNHAYLDEVLKMQPKLRCEVIAIPFRVD